VPNGSLREITHCESTPERVREIPGPPVLDWFEREQLSVSVIDTGSDQVAVAVRDPSLEIG
jgi:hypothetical protein